MGAALGVGFGGGGSKAAKEAAAASAGASEQRERERQRTHLEKNVSKLKENLVVGAAHHRAEIARIMHENVALVKEINQLRRDIFNEEQKEQEIIEEKRHQLLVQAMSSSSSTATLKSGSSSTGSRAPVSGSGVAGAAGGGMPDELVYLSSVQRELMEQQQELDNLRRLVIEAEQARKTELALLRRRMFSSQGMRSEGTPAPLTGPVTPTRSARQSSSASSVTRTGSQKRLPPLPLSPPVASPTLQSGTSIKQHDTFQSPSSSSSSSTSSTSTSFARPISPALRTPSPSLRPSSPPAISSSQRPPSAASQRSISSLRQTPPKTNTTSSISSSRSRPSSAPRRDSLNSRGSAASHRSLTHI